MGVVSGDRAGRAALFRDGHPSRTALTRGAPSRDVYLAELRKVQPFVPLLDGATLVDGPWGADASVYAASRYAGEGFLLAGDAASAIDPLSSFGVKKALASGWLGAVAANTVLRNPMMAGEALEFFNRREHALFASAQRQASGIRPMPPRAVGIRSGSQGRKPPGPMASISSPT